jgi:hypothetical protein
MAKPKSWMHHYFAIRSKLHTQDLRIEKAATPVDAYHRAFGAGGLLEQFEWKDLGSRTLIIESTTRKMRDLKDQFAEGLGHRRLGTLPQHTKTWRDFPQQTVKERTDPSRGSGSRSRGGHERLHEKRR